MHNYLFCFSSLSDRKLVDSGDEMVVMIVPDHQMLEYVEKIASTLSDDPVNLWALFYLYRNHFLLEILAISEI